MKPQTTKALDLFIKALNENANLSIEEIEQVAILCHTVLERKLNVACYTVTPLSLQRILDCSEEVAKKLAKETQDLADIQAQLEEHAEELFSETKK